MVDLEIPAIPHPSLRLPQGNATVDVSIINTTTDIVVPAGALVQPVQKGHEKMNMPTFAFLIENKSLGKTIIFDLGCRKDWWNHSPSAKASLVAGILGIKVAKSINEILREGGVRDGQVDAVIWSHWHFDHIGDMTLFPTSTDLYVGPGFKDAFMPGYPAKHDSPLLEANFKDRNLHEVSFESSEKIGAFPCFDLFGDASFFVLDVPGHAIGHLSGFARTTPDTFVFMGGDVCHFGGSYRPSIYAPMPSTIPSSVPMDCRFPKPCPCSIFHPAHRNQENYRTQTFYEVTQQPGAWYVDPPTAQKSVDSLAEFDANENVLVCLAHDGGLLPVVDWFPKRKINDWKLKAWKEASRWGFLNELPQEEKPRRPLLVPGMVRDGKVIQKDDL